MFEKKYYDKYWNKDLDAKNLHLPPEWTNINLLWHLDFFKKYIGENIADIGAGDGTFLNFLVSNVKSIKTAVAAEPSEKAISIGREKYKDLLFKKESIEKLSLPDNHFDTIFAIEVVEHLLDTDTCFIQLTRILKKGGFLCITTTDFNWLKKIMIGAFFWDKFFYPNNPHIRFYTKKTLIDIASKHCLQLVDYKWNKSYFGIMPKGQMIVFKK